jgi:hypothetical protein
MVLIKASKTNLDNSSNFIEPPVIKLAPGQTFRTEIIEGRSLTLSVSIFGFNVPLTSVTWKYQRTVLISGARISITNTPTLPAASGPVISTLQLTEAERGNYSVTAFNSAGDSTLLFTVAAIGKRGLSS